MGEEVCICIDTGLGVAHIGSLSRRSFLPFLSYPALPSFSAPRDTAVATGSDRYVTPPAFPRSSPSLQPTRIPEGQEVSSVQLVGPGASNDSPLGRFPDSVLCPLPLSCPGHPCGHRLVYLFIGGYLWLLSRTFTWWSRSVRYPFWGLPL